MGWYKHGAAPGSKRGTTVIVGHRDSFNPEPGAFYYLNKIETGDLIHLQYKNYTIFYSVKKIKIVRKNYFYKISQQIFTISGKPKLALISCTGIYEKNNGGYQNNIIIIAELLT